MIYYSNLFNIMNVEYFGYGIIKGVVYNKLKSNIVPFCSVSLFIKDDSTFKSIMTMTANEFGEYKFDNLNLHQTYMLYAKGFTLDGTYVNGIFLDNVRVINE